MKRTRLLVGWLVEFIVFWTADMVIWYSVYGISNFYYFGTPARLTLRNAASDTWSWAVGEILGSVIVQQASRKKNKQQEGQEN